MQDRKLGYYWARFTGTNRWMIVKWVSNSLDNYRFFTIPNVGGVYDEDRFDRLVYLPVPDNREI
jgi:hypothetical protein